MDSRRSSRTPTPVTARDSGDSGVPLTTLPSGSTNMPTVYSQASNPFNHTYDSPEPTDQSSPYITEYTVSKRIKAFICYFTSAICSMAFLTLLMVCALVSNYWDFSKLRPRIGRYTRGDLRGDTRVRNEKLPKEERKLTMDLQYYLNLAKLDVDAHVITTTDGFRLEMHRIVDRTESQAESHGRYPVLLLHGLLQSSAAFCTSGNSSIALELFNAGYDVWLGNNRCGFEPNHVLYSRYNPKMWQWSIKEMANIDLPCLIDYVLSYTSSNDVALAAHSQGTTQTFYAMSRNSPVKAHLKEKLSSFSALAPAVYAGPLLNRWFLKGINYMNRHVYHFFFGEHSFINLMNFMQKFMSAKLYTFFGYIMFNYMLGWNDALWDKNYRNRQFLFSPVYVSAELMYWWLGSEGFAHDKCIFNQESTPWFDEAPPVCLFVPGKDNLCDGEALINRLQVHETLDTEIHHLGDYSHLDVLWASDVNEKVARPLKQFIWKNVRAKGKWPTTVQRMGLN